MCQEKHLVSYYTHSVERKVGLLPSQDFLLLLGMSMALMGGGAWGELGDLAA